MRGAESGATAKRRYRTHKNDKRLHRPHSILPLSALLLLALYSGIIAYLNRLHNFSSPKIMRSTDYALASLCV